MQPEMSRMIPPPVHNNTPFSAFISFVYFLNSDKRINIEPILLIQRGRNGLFCPEETLTERGIGRGMVVG